MSKTPSRAAAAIDMLRAEHEGPAGLERRQRQRLAELLAHARARSPFYCDRYAHLPQSALPLTDLPPVTKPELMAHFDAWVTDPRITRHGVEAFLACGANLGRPFLGEYLACTSSGTTGHPALFIHDQRAINVYRAIALARIDRSWVSPRGVWEILLKRTRWAAAVGTAGHFAAAGWMEHEKRRGGLRRHAYAAFSVEQPLADLVAQLNRYDPAALTTYPSALELLAQERMAGRLHIDPVIIEATGESLSAADKVRMGAAFGRPVHEAYGTSEFQCIAFDCDCGWLHVNSDWIVVEPVDAHHAPTPPGTPSHTVLITSLANQVQPLIRYDLGDSVLVSDTPCPCGSPLPAIRVQGRKDDTLHLRTAAGAVVHITPLAIGSVIEQAGGLQRFQLVQTGPCDIRVRIEPHAGADAQEVWQQVAAHLQTFLAAQGLSNVQCAQGYEPFASSGLSGKFRQVIGLTEGGT